MKSRNLCLIGLMGVTLVLLSSVAVAQSPLSGDPELAMERSNLWIDAFVKFYANHPDLDGDQLMLIWDAVDAGRPGAFRDEASKRSWRSGDGAPLMQIIQRTEKLFALNQRGEIFSAMGSVQTWLVKNAALAVPLCNCKPVGSTTVCQSYPQPNHCATGCQSWSEKVDGVWKHWTGICTAGPSPYEDTSETGGTGN